MIFRPELAKLVRQGKKSQTRRRADEKHCRYQPGKSYAVQPGRGRPAICRITINAVRLEPLGDITLKDARREGFVTTAEFFEYWQDLHGHVDRDTLVWVISFTLGDATDTPRLLAARPGAPHGDYVANPHLSLRDEPEAVSEWEQEQFSKLAHARDDIRVKDPVRLSRDRIARELETMRDHLQVHPSAELAASVRQMERVLLSMDRKLAA